MFKISIWPNFFCVQVAYGACATLGDGNHNFYEDFLTFQMSLWTYRSAANVWMVPIRYSGLENTLTEMWNQIYYNKFCSAYPILTSIGQNQNLLGVTHQTRPKKRPFWPLKSQKMAWFVTVGTWKNGFRKKSV